MHKYLAIVFFTAVSLLTAIAVANYLVNPYLVFAAPAWHGINEVITESFYKQPLFKPYQLRALQPRSVILGSSPAGIALDPDKLPAPAYNLAIGGATSYMNYRLLQEALATSPQLQQVILEMPFFAFNSDDPNNQANLDSEFEQRLSLQADGAPNRALPLFVCRDQLDTLVTWDVSRASFRTLLKQQRVSEKKKGSYIQFRNGQWTQQFPAGQSTYAIIEGSWKKFLYNDWFPAPHYTFTLTNNEQNDPLDYYRQSLRLLYAHNIHTQLVIAPVHGSLLLAQQAAGLQIDFFRWKKFLVEINAAEAARAGKPPFELVDYATINAIQLKLYRWKNKTSGSSGFSMRVMRRRHWVNSCCASSMTHILK